MKTILSFDAHCTDGNRLSNGQFLYHSEMRAELQIAMQGVGTDALLVCALNVMSVCSEQETCIQQEIAFHPPFALTKC